MLHFVFLPSSKSEEKRGGTGSHNWGNMKEEVREMTLDEWKAMQDKERTKVEFNIRKPNEGADSQWKKGYVLHKSKSEDVSVANPTVCPGGVLPVGATQPNTWLPDSVWDQLSLY
ncbi:hypothetical protein XENOCAPTIV_014855 [Xenoophorus captivus]|uniref:Hyaluronan/mRNA-binding protein domain-containing protein n=1 Tax=Xenoophorus captivus TaxID=1517983 RepID=A0ABV0SBK3_9TELE